MNVSEASIQGFGKRHRAEYLIKMVFVIKTREERKKVFLRWKQLKKALEEFGYDIEDTPLNRALIALRKEGLLVKDEHGYSLVEAITKTDQETATLLVDTVRIRRAYEFGLVTELEKAWSYYGVPLLFRNHIAPKLRDEVTRFQERVLEILDKEQETLAMEIAQIAKGRVGKDVIRKSQLAIRDGYYRDLGIGQGTSYNLWSAEVHHLPSESNPAFLIERMRFEKVPKNLEAGIPYFAHRLGTSERNLWREVDRLKALKNLLESLAPEDRILAETRLIALALMASSLCAVVRFPDLKRRLVKRNR